MIRADESIHKEVNHHFADMSPDADIEHEMITVADVKEKIVTGSPLGSQ